MKRYSAFIVSFTVIIITALAVNGCNDPFDINEPQSVNSSETQKFMKIAESSSSVNSFTPNYNEEQAMALAGALGKNLYPIRIGQKMKLVDKSLTLVKDSTTATGTLVQKFDGQLIIQGSFQEPTIGMNSHVDTTITKNFSTTVTRKIQFKKIANSGNDTIDWKVNAVSLSSGGTAGDNIQIVKLILTTQDGTEVVIDDPNTFFFKTGKEKKYKDHDEDEEEEMDDNDNHGFEAGFSIGEHGWKNLLTWYRKNQPIKLTVEILSRSADPDFITVTYGAMMYGNSRSKEKFNLVSSNQEGSYYRKIYERKLYTHSFAARMHAVVNALPRNVVYDTDTSVEEKTWGIPYRVK
ncbi:MAG: hypothetical protein FD122_3433 [Stygiobacter sp.]|nr:MAG: hypothetical protein FD122_3433 [Stygiobacter sp.]KAF0215442.1 MAG: hypothetical protein FD178_1726 [Ignavibacteria bacterium]